ELPRRKSVKPRPRCRRQSSCRPTGNSGGEVVGAIGTEHGPGSIGSAWSGRIRKPRYRYRTRGRFRRMRARSDRGAVEAARTAAAYDLMFRRQAAQLVQHYGAQLAALSLCLPPGEVAAAAARLRSERDAAIEALRGETPYPQKNRIKNEADRAPTMAAER